MLFILTFSCVSSFSKQCIDVSIYIMQKIVPNLWFDTEAIKASEFYTSIFPHSSVLSTTVLHDTPSGDVDIVSFKLLDYTFMAINAGPLFKLNPSISFMVNFDPSQDKDAKEKLDELWNKLIVGGKALMAIDKYPFSERYGWVEDKYGLSWQLILTKPEGEKRPSIIPALLFVGDVYGKAKEASDFYISTFKNTNRGVLALYPAGMEPDKEGAVMFTDFTLENQWFAAMESAHNHAFAFNEAISFMVNCEDQNEIDYYWDKLSAVSEAEQCGWLKDKYGISWQIVPKDMQELLEKDLDKTTQAMLKMKKIIVEDLKKAGKK